MDNSTEYWIDPPFLPCCGGIWESVAEDYSYIFGFFFLYHFPQGTKIHMRGRSVCCRAKSTIAILNDCGSNRRRVRIRCHLLLLLVFTMTMDTKTTRGFDSYLCHEFVTTCLTVT